MNAYRTGQQSAQILQKLNERNTAKIKSKTSVKIYVKLKYEIFLQ